MHIINSDNVVIINGDNRTTFSNTIAERQILEHDYPEIYAECVKEWAEPVYPTAEELAEIEAQEILFMTETTNKRSLEEVLLTLQSDMRAWVSVPNASLTDADIKKGIKLAMRAQIKLIRLVLNKLEGVD